VFPVDRLSRGVDPHPDHIDRSGGRDGVEVTAHVQYLWRLRTGWSPTSPPTGSGKKPSKPPGCGS